METIPNDDSQGASEDEYHLHLLSVFHYVVAGLSALAGCLPLLCVLMGIFLMAAGVASNRPDSAVPMLMGGGMMMFGLLLFVFLEALAVGQLLNARYLQTHRHHTYCLVVAVINCLSFPLGTILGTFTILVLVRPSVRKLFGVD
ncbi:hypothetical protein [Blastopirellula marina]|uniref:Uncharacterized protein n=1 Tax=Blastopirellula marina TaxID=124 RepID=A0A2S8GNU0_9BACT|nr:hypothetical protein [Blastopirellula marina]PQO46021.1 hypothetical protein C5Y93_10580 [Blastopirellula marina]